MPLWRGLTHQELYDQLQAGPGPYVSESAVTAWNEVEATLRKIDGDLAGAIAQAGGWTGGAADTARDGLTPLGRWAVDAAAAAGRAGVSIRGHQEQVAIARNAMPEPGPAVAVAPPAVRVDNPRYARWVEQQAANADLAQQAFHVMDTYATNTGMIQHWVPSWSAPPTVTVAVRDPTTAAAAGTSSPIRPAAVTGAAQVSAPAAPTGPGTTGTAGVPGAATTAEPATAAQNDSAAGQAPDTGTARAGTAPTVVAGGPGTSAPTPSPAELPLRPPTNVDQGGRATFTPTSTRVPGGGDLTVGRPAAPTTWRDLAARIDARRAAAAGWAPGRRRGWDRTRGQRTHLGDRRRRAGRLPPAGRSGGRYPGPDPAPRVLPGRRLGRVRPRPPVHRSRARRGRTGVTIPRPR